MSTVNRADLTCKELVELVTDYLEERLSEGERARFDRHLAECPFCTTYVEQMRQVVRAAGRLPEDSVAPEALGALLAHFRKWE